MRFQFKILSLICIFIGVGCNEVQPSNPYDPEAPLSVQFKGKLKGVLRIQGRELEATESYTLQVLNAQNQPIVDEQGEIIVYETRTQADLDKLKSDDETAVIGSFEIQLEMGVYSLLFDPKLNGNLPLSRERSPQIEVRPGQVYTMDLFIQKVQSYNDEYECLVSLECALGEACIEGYCVSDVDADRDRDGVPDGSIETPIDNCPDLENPTQMMQTQMDKEIPVTLMMIMMDNLIQQTIAPSNLIRFKEMQMEMEQGMHVMTKSPVFRSEVH